MYGITGMPDLLPPTGSLQPSSQIPSHQNGLQDSLHRYPTTQRSGQRPPKLGQIGRSKKVDLEDEDLDVMMNDNNRRFSISIEVSPVA